MRLKYFFISEERRGNKEKSRLSDVKRCYIAPCKHYIFSVEVLWYVFH